MSRSHQQKQHARGWFAFDVKAILLLCIYYFCVKVIKREIQHEVVLPAGIQVDRMEHSVTFDGHLRVLLLLGDQDCQYRVTTLSATTLHDNASFRDDGGDDDDDNQNEDKEAVTEQLMTIDDNPQQ